MKVVRFPYLPYAAGLGLLALLWQFSATYDIPIRRLTADPAQVYKAPFYIGFLSNLTIVAWALGAFSALFAAWCIRRQEGAAEWYRFFRLAGIFTTVLLLDDLFMFHEEIFPNYLFMPWKTGLNPNEKIVIGSYGLFGLWFIYSSRSTIRKTTWSHLAVASGILAFGIFADRGVAKKVFTDSTTRAFVEDAAKFLGVLGWSLYYSQTGAAVVRQYMVAPEAAIATSDDSSQVEAVNTIPGAVAVPDTIG